VRWGIGDAILAFAVGSVGSALIVLPLIDPNTTNDPTATVVLVYAQDLIIIGWLAMVARRKGLGSLRLDFGLQVRRPAADWLHDLPWFFIGIGIQLAAIIPIAILNEVYGHDAEQEVVTSLKHAGGWQIPVFAVGVAVLAPIAEELVFRGVLLRSLERRMLPTAAVLVSALAFGLVHTLGDPSVGTVKALTVFVFLGIVSGYQAVRTGSLSRSILLHMGFNALTVVSLFVLGF
jgi:membrane protease YdiL (CAAX protease family)